MEEQLFRKIISEKDHIFQARVLVLKLTGLAGVSKRRQVVFAAAVSDMLQDLLRQGKGFMDLGLSAKGGRPAIVVRIFSLNPGSWRPDRDFVLEGDEFRVRFNEDGQLRLSIGSGELDELPGPETLDAWRERLEELSEQESKTIESVLLGGVLLEKKIEEYTQEEFRRLQDQLKDVDETVFALFNVLERKNEQLERARRESEANRERAERERRAKTQFLYQVSHDIRTPLNAMTGMVDLLAGTDLSPEQEQYLRIFDQAGESLLYLVNDLLDLSRIEAGILTLSEEAVDVRWLIGRSLSLFTRELHEKSVALNTTIDPDCPPRILGDPRRLEQILVNLVSNAVQNTEEGSINVRVRTQSKDDDQLLLICEVSDTGRGIPAHEQEEIFQAFTTADRDDERDPSGAGLGLSITKRLLRRMGGSIDVESVPGEGSTFTFRIPCRRPETGRETEIFSRRTFSGSLRLDGRRILIVDDQTTCDLVLTAMLNEWGAAVTAVDSDRELLERVREDANGYDVIFLNPLLSGMQGQELLEELREIIDLKRVILLADPEKPPEQLVENYDVSGLLTRPLIRSRVLDRIVDLLGEFEEEADEGTGATPSELGLPSSRLPVDLLIAEDNRVNRRVISMYLEDHPVNVVFAENGKEALRKMKSSSPDLIFMDLRMPDMDGLSATKEIRALESEENRERTPVVALTAEALDEQKREAREAGCDDHMVKPASEDEMLRRIEQHLAGDGPSAESRGPEAEERAASGSPGGEEPEDAGPPDEPKEEEKPPLRIDEEFMDLVPEFVQEAREDLRKMEDALDTQEPDVLADLAHKLKGAAGFYGLNMVVKWSKEIEGAAEERDFEEVRKNTERLIDRIDRIDDEFG